jgi:hypothetical protein
MCAQDHNAVLHWSAKLNILNNRIGTAYGMLPQHGMTTGFNHRLCWPAAIMWHVPGKPADGNSICCLVEHLLAALSTVTFIHTG